MAIDQAGTTRLFAVGLTMLAGCGQPPGPAQLPAPPPAKTEVGVAAIQYLTRDEISAAQLSILFVGNSHSAPLPVAFADLARQHNGTLRVLASRASASGFLDNHARTVSTPKAITSGPWDFVVLQALKYSTSGKYEYPYDGAIALTRMAQANGSRVIMFPEWGRRGFPAEAARIQRLHEEVAATTAASVAPVGLAWDRALAARPELVLHHSDGNHASPLGDYLTACVLYAVATNSDPRLNSEAADQPARLASTPPETLRFLEQTAWDTVQLDDGSGSG